MTIAFISFERLRETGESGCGGTDSNLIEQACVRSPDALPSSITMAWRLDPNGNQTYLSLNALHNYDPNGINPQSSVDVFAPLTYLLQEHDGEQLPIPNGIRQSGVVYPGVAVSFIKDGVLTRIVHDPVPDPLD